MHFLSHYYIDRGRHNELFVVGALLPDIAPHFTKTYNKSIRNSKHQFESPLDEIHQGVLRHYMLDAVFHNSVAFKEACTMASGEFVKSGLDREKYRFWFMSHIVIEVMLDRQLILADEKLVDEYYSLLSSVDIHKLEAYLNFLVEKDEKNRILSNFMRFLEVRFLQYLTGLDGAAEAITRTMDRATGVTFSQGDRINLVSALHNIETDMRYRVKNLLEVDI